MYYHKSSYTIGDRVKLNARSDIPGLQGIIIALQPGQWFTIKLTLRGYGLNIGDTITANWWEVTKI